MLPCAKVELVICPEHVWATNKKRKVAQNNAATRAYRFLLKLKFFPICNVPPLSGLYYRLLMSI